MSKLTSPSWHWYSSGQYTSSSQDQRILNLESRLSLSSQPNFRGGAQKWESWDAHAQLIELRNFFYREKSQSWSLLHCCIKPTDCPILSLISCQDNHHHRQHNIRQWDGTNKPYENIQPHPILNVLPEDGESSGRGCRLQMICHSQLSLSFRKQKPVVVSFSIYAPCFFYWREPVWMWIRPWEEGGIPVEQSRVASAMITSIFSGKSLLYRPVYSFMPDQPVQNKIKMWPEGRAYCISPALPPPIACIKHKKNLYR